ncbi:MAG: hypothetical protein IJ409_08790 [Lachnospiraceae bacterium]|nr:hypothetical protein [Lachnospiraceae bacterium]
MRSLSNKSHLTYIWILIFCLLAGNVFGCAKVQEGAEQTAAVEGESAEVELLDPVGVATNYDVASYRDIYNADVYSCIICPTVTEFAYTTDSPFSKYGKLPGEEVVSEDILVYGDTTGMDEEYEQLVEDIDDKVEDYEDSMSDLQEDLYDAKQNEYEAAVPYMESINEKPEESSSGYDMWARLSMPAEASYRAAVMAREKIEQSIKESEELFALEQEYDSGRMERLAGKISEAQVASNTEGSVVAINAYMSGDYIQKNTNVIAVGDMSKKALHIEYVSKSKVEKAEDVYAMIDGKRYEVVYEVMEKEEYARLKKLNDTVYSTFYLADPNDEIPMGKFATLVIVEESSKNTLAVMADALHRDGQDYYCYLFDGTNSVMTSVTIGLTDGKYTEVLSGIKEGDKVLISEPVNAKGKMHTLEMGSVVSEYSGSGLLYYPSTEWIVNPAKIGTFYINEICVEQYEQVEAGQALAKIEVISDQISINRVERKIQRQQERLDKLLEKKSKIYSDEIDRSLERAIESRQKAIEDLNEELSELTEYTGEITLTAPYAGIITNVTDLEEGDLISYNQKLVQMADQSLCYVIVEDQEGQLSYGNEATITYVGEGSIKKNITGTVVSVNKSALSKQLQTGFALILISEEDIGEIARYGSTVGSGGWNRNRFAVTAEIRGVDNVLLVPKRAVTVYNQNTFVTVKKADGSYTYVSFISGGSDQENYWVVQGLDEGMEVCLE